MSTDIDRARSALQAIDAGCDRDTWAIVGMAAKDAGLTVEEFIRWSEDAANFGGEKDCRAAWRSFKPGKVTASTLYGKAMDSGWKPQTNGNEAPADEKGTASPRKDQGRPFDFAAVWEASEPARADHPYIARKRGLPDGLRVYRGDLAVAGQAIDGALLVPLHDVKGRLQSWQAIPAHGDKRSAPGARIKGGSFLVGGAPGKGDELYVVEGIGAAWSVHQVSGKPAAVCFGSGNVESVALQMRERFAQARIVIVPDVGQVGTAKRVAELVGGAWVELPSDLGDNGDINDLHLRDGAEAVTRVLAQAVSANDWPEAQPITAKVDPQPYPLDALPPIVAAAVREVAGFVQAPVPLVATSALGALSLACQGHYDVQRAERLQGPISLFLLAIADSGERKTTCDGFFSSAIFEYEVEQAEAAKPELKRHAAALAAWTAEREGTIAAIKEASRKGGQDDRIRLLQAKLEKLENEKPEGPRVPRMIFGDATPEALTWSLAKTWPSAGVMSSEAGSVFGAHGMGRDSIMRNLAILNQCWDGRPQYFDRRTSESYTVRGARLTAALQVQEATLREFIDRSGELARGSGFLARFLVSWPQSTQGQRSFKEAPAAWPALTQFHSAIRRVLAAELAVDDNGALDPPMLSLSRDAKAAWIRFHDAIEAQLAAGGELETVRDVASKTADNAVRLAALLHIFGGGGAGAIGLETFEGAARVVAWHLSESRRFFGEMALPQELADAASLDRWLVERCRREGVERVGKSVPMQYGPPSLRKKEALDAAVSELEELDRVRIEKDGKRSMLAVNPGLLAGGAP